MDMYCSNCGMNFGDREERCPFCATPTPNFNGSNYSGQYPPPFFDPNLQQPFFFRDPSNVPAETGLVVLSVLIPLAGLILGCISFSKGEKRAGRAYLLAAGISYAARIFLIFAYVFMFYLIR